MSNEQKDATDKYFAGLTEAQLDEAEKIEEELNAWVHPGFTERSATAFVIAFPLIRKRLPGATVGSVFELTMAYGLAALITRLDGEAQAPNRAARRNTKKPKSGARLVR